MNFVRPIFLLALLTAAAIQQPVAAQANVRSATAEERFEDRVLSQLNRVRTDPAGYADYLSTWRPRYRADGLLARPGEMPIRTREGVAALDDAIRELRHTAPLLELNGCEPLAESAREFAAEQARTGSTGHGFSPFNRLARHGVWQDAAGENIAYGSATPEAVVAELVIDDGQRRRGHRANILNGSFHLAGIGFDRHPRYGAVCVIDFAGGFAAR